MATTAGIGASVAEETTNAAQELVAAARTALGGATPSGALVFATAAHDQGALLATLRRELGDIPLAGCSGEGIIAGRKSREQDHAAALMLFASDAIRFRHHAVGRYAQDSAAAGRTLGEAILAAGDGQPRLVCVFTDGLAGDCTAFLNALATVLPEDTPVVGGASADDLRFEVTYQYAGERVCRGHAAAFVMEGPLRPDVLLSHGCQAIGRDRTVTESEAGWVISIDGRNAWDEFRSYLGPEVQDLNADGIAHLCLGQHHAAGTYVVRTPMQLDAERGALFFPGGGMREGQTFRIMRRDEATIRTGVQEAAAHVARDDPPFALLQFDCAGRGRLLFGSRVSETLLHPMIERLGDDVPVIGFHTYGEIAPHHGVVRYHNYTAAYCALHEDAGARG